MKHTVRIPQVSVYDTTYKGVTVQTGEDGQVESGRVEGMRGTFPSDSAIARAVNSILDKKRKRGIKP